MQVPTGQPDPLTVIPPGTYSPESLASQESGMPSAGSGEGTLLICTAAFSPWTGTDYSHVVITGIRSHLLTLTEFA